MGSEFLFRFTCQAAAETAYDMVNPGLSMSPSKRGQHRLAQQPADLREGVSNAYHVVAQVRRKEKLKSADCNSLILSHLYPHTASTAQTHHRHPSSPPLNTTSTPSNPRLAHHQPGEILK